MCVLDGVEEMAWSRKCMSSGRPQVIRSTVSSQQLNVCGGLTGASCAECVSMADGSAAYSDCTP